MRCSECRHFEDQKLGMKKCGFCTFKKVICSPERESNNCRYFSKEDWEKEITGPLAMSKIGVHRVKDFEQ